MTTETRQRKEDHHAGRREGQRLGVGGGGSYTGSGSADNAWASGVAAAPAPGESPWCGEAAGGSSPSPSSEDERSWRSRARSARDQVERARKKLVDTPSRITRHKSYGGGGFMTYDNPSCKSAEEELKNPEAALSNIEEDARRQRIQSGWLR